MIDDPPGHPATIYAQRAEAYAARRQAFAERSKKISYARVATFLTGAACLLVAAIAEHVPAGWLFATGGALIVVFFVLVAWHSRIESNERRYEALTDINEVALRKLRRDWSHIAVPSEAAPPAHPYAEDLDLFGRASLFALLWNGGSESGRQRLADWLLAAATPEEIGARQHAVEELGPLVDLRQEMLAAARTGALETHRAARFLEWAESRPWLRTHRVATWTIRALTAAIVVLIVLQVAGIVHRPLWLAPVAASFVVSNLLAVRLERTFDRAFAHQAVYRSYAELFRLISSMEFQAPLLRDVQAALVVDGHTASQQMARLQRLMELADLRHSALLHFPVQVLTLWDFHVLLLVERWQVRVGGLARRWFDALATFEALAGLSALRFDHPSWALPEIQETGIEVLEATALGHPLLPADIRVDNDVRVGPPGTFLLVTGSNMSGKSTLLRAIGVNVVLAQAGAPVCAAALRLPPARLYTSMRVQDSLEQGVSFFMAAVKRLKQVVEAADQPAQLAPRHPALSPATVARGSVSSVEGSERERVEGSPLATDRPALLFYLLDEVLQGTNTAERQIAVRSIVRHLIARPAIGAITTHDLTLAAAPELAAAAQSVHFTEHLESSSEGAVMRFDYRLRPGLATSRNALRLMQMVGLEVAEERPSGPAPLRTLYSCAMGFRERLLATIAAARPVLETPGVMVVGSEVPNLLEPGAAATLVVSLDLDVGVPVARHGDVKRRLVRLEPAFSPSPEEPSVWIPRSPDLLEVNFVGIDPSRDPTDAYVLEDDRLPLLVFGALSLLAAGSEIELAGTRVCLPRPAGLLLEKLVTDRPGEKGERDLLVALGLLMTAGPPDVEEFVIAYRRLRPDLQHAVRSNLTVLSLLDARTGMPDPRAGRGVVAGLLRRLERAEGDTR